MAALALPLALGACGDTPVEPGRIPDQVAGARVPVKGTGLVLESLTDVTVPIIGLPLATLEIDQVQILDLHVVEDIAGAIVGIEATGVLSGVAVTAVGTEVIQQEFTTGLGVVSGGPGQCDVVSLDLGPIGLDALGLVQVDVPAADVKARGSGAVGSLLCALGSALSGLGSAIPGLVNAINNQI
jgi:hypothetical protein